MLQVCKLQQVTEDSLKPFNRQFVWDGPCCLSLGFLFEWETKRNPRDMRANSQILSGSVFLRIAPEQSCWELASFPLLGECGVSSRGDEQQ